MDYSVSAVIPTYNAAASLPEAIRSVRAQEWPELEIIVVDDGSNDETSRVLEDLTASDTLVLRQPNAGPGAARNRGIAVASGFWIAFLDADDAWMGMKLKMQMAALEGDPAAAFSYADGLLCCEQGNQRLQSPHLPGGNLFLGLLKGPQFPMGTVVVRRDCFPRLGMFDTELRTGDDWGMWLRLAGEYSGVYLPTALLKVDRRQENSRKYPLELLERCTLRVLERLFTRAETRARWPEVISQRRQLYAWHYSVLAKSYLRQGRIRDFCRLALASVAAHPRGLLFVGHRWSKRAGEPDFKHLT